MSDKIRSLLDELDEMVPTKDKHVIIESRAHHFITSGINLIKLIEENFTESEANELTRRLFNSLKTKNPIKFERKIRQIKENNENE